MLPGSPRYLSNLIHSLVQDTGVAFPSSIFTSLLLCMVAGHKHIILRTREEDVGEVKALVVRILVTIFGLPTQRIAVRAEDASADFLSDVFLVPPPGLVSSDVQKSPTGSPTLHSRMSSLGRTRSSRRKVLARSSHGHGLDRTDSGSSIGMGESFTFGNLKRHDHQTPSATSDATIKMMTTTNSRAGHSRKRSTTGTVNTIMASSPLRRRQSRKSSKKAFLSPTSDDTASVKALRPQSTHGLHIETNPPTPTTPLSPLPGLLTPGEYPPHHHGHNHSHHSHHHHTGLRATSPSSGGGEWNGGGGGGMSLSSLPRLPHALVVSKLEMAKKSVQMTLAEMLRTGTISLEDESTDDWWDTDPPEGRELDEEEAGHEDGADRGGGGTWNLPLGFVVVYVCPLGDGRERPPIHKSLLDRFAFSAPIRLETDVYNVSPGPFKRTALISREDIDHLQALCASTHISPRLHNYIFSLLTAARHHPSLDAALLTARAVADYTDLVRASRVVLGREESVTVSSAASPSSMLSSARVLSASDADARRMVMSGLEHRLRVREGGGEYVMASLVSTAVGVDESNGADVSRKVRQRGRHGRSTVSALGDEGPNEEAGYDAEQSSMEDGKGASNESEDGYEEERHTVQEILQSILEEV